MNKRVTSKDKLLKDAKKIVWNEGLDKLSIRNLAKEANVSIGSVYNYFPSKAELVLAVVDDYWKAVFYEDICKVQNLSSFPDFSENVFARLIKHGSEFQSLFMSHLKILDKEKMLLLKQGKKNYYKHIKEGFMMVLEKDKNIDPNVCNKHFTQDLFLDLVFREMVHLMSQKNDDFTFLRAIILSLLNYNQGGNINEKIN